MFIKQYGMATPVYSGSSSFAWGGGGVHGFKYELSRACGYSHMPKHPHLQGNTHFQGHGHLHRYGHLRGEGCASQHAPQSIKSHPQAHSHKLRDEGVCKSVHGEEHIRTLNYVEAWQPSSHLKRHPIDCNETPVCHPVQWKPIAACPTICPPRPSLHVEPHKIVSNTHHSCCNPPLSRCCGYGGWSGMAENINYDLSGGTGIGQSWFGTGHGIRSITGGQNYSGAGIEFLALLQIVSKGFYQTGLNAPQNTDYIKWNREATPPLISEIGTAEGMRLWIEQQLINLGKYNQPTFL